MAGKDPSILARPHRSRTRCGKLMEASAQLAIGVGIVIAHDPLDGRIRFLSRMSSGETNIGIGVEHLRRR